MLIHAGDSEFAENITEPYAELYSADCDFPCPPSIAKRWDPAHRRWFTFHGDPEASMIDFEEHVQIYTDETELRKWLTARRDSGSRRASVIYSDLSNAAKAAHWARDLPFKWLVADWTGIKTPFILAADLIRYGVPVDQAQHTDIAGQQYAVDAKSCHDVWFGYW